MPYRKRTRSKWKEEAKKRAQMEWDRTTLLDLETRLTSRKNEINQKLEELQKLNLILKNRDDELASSLLSLQREKKILEAQKADRDKTFFSRLFSNVGSIELKIFEVDSKISEQRIAIAKKYDEVYKDLHQRNGLDRYRKNVTEEIGRLNLYVEKTLPRLIEKKKREQAKVAKQESLAAAAAAHFGKTRDQADSIKRSLTGQTKIYPNCPYCAGPLGEQPHADHIFPVVRGGLSTSDNLVIVCAVCNGKKADKTLREFILNEKFDRAKIENILEKLGKRF